MLDGPNARLVILLLFITIVAVITGIVILAVVGVSIPMVLYDVLTTLIGIIAGAFGLHPIPQSNMEPLLPTMKPPNGVIK